eukprot:gnl/TRDRNA2_/TRDRNA2_186523_c0_seq1.p1 gnl/TRDRNA2_/TRDRNA2_186523_c0~~gnl/TRDRNA2_/TRDRNA2_186523_c0_seq1.p1  ORF type:complete len:199 (-),score=39.22 gnl/TRDRNA2_/TRDRNA2_186523_c0_seq1:133-729(-)
MARSLVLACLWVCLAPVRGIEVTISLKGKEKKCYGEQAAKGELLVCEFVAVDKKKVSVNVMSPHSSIFSDHERERIKTAFTTSEAGPHWMCVTNDEATAVEVKITVLAGPQAKDYSKIAKKEHLEDTQVALRRVEESLRNYHNNVLYIRAREERMRQTNDSTAFRVIGFCLFNVVLMICVGGWQMLYFKRFFRSKKII